jgi:hypothetical protein
MTNGTKPGTTGIYRQDAWSILLATLLSFSPNDS